MDISQATRVTTPLNFTPFLPNIRPLYPVTEEYLFRTTNALASLQLLQGYLQKWRRVGLVLRQA